jgi:ABC-type ATPase with predicted acetyltransferase domain
MLTARCKVCNLEITSNLKPQCCGCSNQMTICRDTITAKDMSMVLLINSERNVKDSTVLSANDLEYQENRRKRKVRKLDFEVK